MPFKKQLQVLNSASFNKLALEIFAYQAEYNPLYKKYIELLGLRAKDIKELPQIPYLPIQFFKSYQIQSDEWNPAFCFESSGTTGQTPSKHLVKDLTAYQANCIRIFEQVYGTVNDFCVLALLPSYLERKTASLVYMVDGFIKQSKYPESGFFLDDFEALAQKLSLCKTKNIPVLLIGVSFALLDFAEAHPMDLSHCILMETGGMKGKRKEMIRAEFHQQLKQAFNLKSIHSEYGMTELFSQAYSKGEGRFEIGQSLQVIGREIYDPLCPAEFGKTAALNLIDLANYNTCSFIASDDIGRVFSDGSFEVHGRLDHSELRGCNLMIQDL